MVECKIAKRDGREVSFNDDNIKQAISKAILAVSKADTLTQSESDLVSRITSSIKQKVENSEGLFTVEQIQDLVEEKLMASSRKDVAKAYITYRDERSRIRNRNSKFRETIRDKIYAKNVVNQNANVDEKSFGGRRGEADSVLLKEIALDEMISDTSRKNHLRNLIYTHDLESYVLGMHNCLSVPFDDLLSKGFNTRQTDVRPANSVNTAFQLIAVIFQLQSLQQFGGVSATHLDWIMVPYVKKSFMKHYIVAWLKNSKEFLGLDLMGMLFDEYIEDAGEGGTIYRNRFDDWVDSYKDEFFTKTGLKEQDFFFGNPALDRKFSQSAEFDTIQETQQAAEGLYHNLNTLQSRSGNQLPFTSINYGTCTLPEGRLVIKAMLSGSIKGVGKFHRTSIFPCGIFQYKKGVNDKPGTLNYDLKKLALKSTSKRLYPNYANADWSQQSNYIKMDRDIKNKVLSSLTEDKYNALVKLVLADTKVSEQLSLKVVDGKLEVNMEEKPTEMFSTMGALASHEHLYVKINDEQPVDISISDLFYLCKGDKTIKGKPMQLHYNKPKLYISTDADWRKAQDHSSYTHIDAKPGVYKITYLPEDVSYIGSSNNIRRRMNEHRSSIHHSGGIDAGLYFGDTDLSNYTFEVIEYSDDFELAEQKYIMSVPNANSKGIHEKFYKNIGLQGNKGHDERPHIYMDPSIPQDLIDLKDSNIMVLDRGNKWVKVNHIFKNSEMNTPYMMHISYEDDDKEYTLCCTEDHPLWVGSQFIRADEITTFDNLYRGDGQPLKITSIKWCYDRKESFDIGTETGSFIGSDIIMHNCRTSNGADINFNENYYSMLIDKSLANERIDHLMLSGAQKDGRGNICPVTIILPSVAMLAKGELNNKDIDDFLELLDNKINEAKDMLIERYEWICSQNPESAKFMYENNMMSGYIPEEGIRSALKHGTLALGQLGLAECLQILIGEDHTSKKGMELAKKIEELFKKRCAEFKERYKLNIGVYYTPAENLCYTAMKKFQAQYGKIPNISDREYFTNSMHVPVWDNMSPFDKIDIESQLTGYSNAGCITYVELDGSAVNNIDALEKIVDYAMEKDIPYFAINVPSDTCLDCGHQGEFNDKCPECGSTNIQQLRRVTGYLSGNFKSSFNVGKQCETADRVKHVNKMTSLEGSDC